MKRILSLLTAVTLALCLASCAYIEDGALSEVIDTVQKEKNDTYTVHALYDYGFHITDKAALLYDHSTLFFDIPEAHGTVLGGDCFTIEYTGELLIQESYPSHVVITNGEIVSVSSEKAEVVKVLYTPSADMNFFSLLAEDGSTTPITVDSAPAAYITDPSDGSFEQLPTSGEPVTLFATYCAEHGVSKEGAYKILGLYSEQPR